MSTKTDEAHPRAPHSGESAESTLNQVLAMRGYGHRKSPGCGMHEHDIFDVATDAVVFTGDTTQVWAWLKTYAVEG